MSVSFGDLFDQLCLRWAHEAEAVFHEAGTLAPTLILLPRDVSKDEVPIRLDGLRGNIAERGPALVEELRPTANPHDPAGLVFLAQLRIGSAADADGNSHDPVTVYVSLGSPRWRRALAFDVRPSLMGPPNLARAATDPDVSLFSWLDELLVR
jgi:hypothetical protein